jgi:uncharacterized protein (TIGR00369 family)
MDLLTSLGIKISKKSKDLTIISLKLTDNLKQPFGYLHGGVNSLLAETAASISAQQFAKKNQVAVGVSINTNHLLPVQSGTLLAEAVPVRIGKFLQVWQVKTHLKTSQQPTSFSIVTTKLIQKTD